MIIEITYQWWYLPLVLFIIPFIYDKFRKPTGGWMNFEIDTMLVTAACWVSAIVSIITRLIS